MDTNNVNQFQYYERQLAALGKMTLEKIHKMKVLLVGLRAVGCEVAKNMCQASPERLTLQDESPISEADLTFNFFAKQSDFGKKRSSCVKEQQVLMNPFANINEASRDQLTGDFICQYDLMIATDIFDKEQLENWNFICKKNRTAFICSGCVGFFGQQFNDLNTVIPFIKLF